jgi:hypothetical protein
VRWSLSPRLPLPHLPPLFLFSTAAPSGLASLHKTTNVQRSC